MRLHAKLWMFLLLVVCLITPALATTTTVYYNSSGSFVVPAGVTSIDVYLVGGGGGGARASNGGGGGYTLNVSALAVTPDDIWTVTIGQGGAGGEAGSDGTASTFVKGGASYSAAGGKGAVHQNPNPGNGGSGGAALYGTAGGGAGTGGTDGSNGQNGIPWTGAQGQHYTTREFWEPGGTLYSGGGGAAQVATGVGGDGGLGGGGNGGGNTGGAATNGAPGTGGGGGGGSGPGNGGSGRIAIRYTTGVTPVAAFHASPLVVWRNGTIQFTDDTTNTPTSWSWYDPDTVNPFFTGNLTNQNPKVFPKNWGYHSVNLIACNGAGCSTKASGARYIYVLQPGVI